MKFTVGFASLAILLSGSAQATYIANLNDLKRQDSALVERSNITSRAVGSAFGSGIKRGLSFNDASLTADFNSGEVSWAYNWDSSFSGSLPSGVEYIPMLWGADSDHTSVWEANANTAIANGAQYLLGFNEPDLDTQSNLSPQAAAQAWQTYIQPFAGKAKLVSPAITNGAAPMGTAWLDDFISACSGCTIDAIAIHIYDSATNIAYYESYIPGIASKYNKPVWVTEFGATGSASQQQSFLGQMVQFLDGQSGIAAYAWFMDAVGNLVNSDGSLTALGQTYVSS
ncbi:hypothetical protein AcV5_003026 [Taiwanofungus camphoratus]|nr:hypothetical protein AcV5_003026 [Antrodia cinnamomea]KAI0954272.1 hypothetical protein AcV7_007548 [Antrodia cinnamomea]